MSAIVGFDNRGATFPATAEEEFYGTVTDFKPPEGGQLSVIGYPGDYAGENGGGRQAGMDGTVDKVYPAPLGFLITYKDLDTTGGQSGSPVFYKVQHDKEWGRSHNSDTPYQWFLVGVHVGTDGHVNVATAITPEVLSWTEEVLQRS